MERIVNAEFSELIGYSINALPRRIWERINYVHFLTGTDPIYAGLHNFVDIDDEYYMKGEEKGNKSYRNVPQVVCPEYQFILPKLLRNTTIVLPVMEQPWVVVHELGHVLDEALGYSHLALPITEYAKINEGEAFAEAFVGWMCEDYGEPDVETTALFEYLAWG